jgi:hypothetical protein
MSEYRATSSRNARATSSESAKIPDWLWQDISTAAIERGMKPTKFCHLLLQIAVKDQIIDAILDPVPGKAPAQKYAPAQRRAPAPSLGMLMTGPTLEGRIDGVQFEAVAPTYHLAGWLVVSTVTLSPSRMPRRFRRASSNRFLSSGSAWSRSSIKARRASWMIRFPGAPL